MVGKKFKITLRLHYRAKHWFWGLIRLTHQLKLELWGLSIYAFRVSSKQFRTVYFHSKNNGLVRGKYWKKGERMKKRFGIIQCEYTFFWSWHRNANIFSKSSKLNSTTLNYYEHFRVRRKCKLHGPLGSHNTRNRRRSWPENKALTNRKDENYVLKN